MNDSRTEDLKVEGRVWITKLETIESRLHIPFSIWWRGEDLNCSLSDTPLCHLLGESFTSLIYFCNFLAI